MAALAGRKTRVNLVTGKTPVFLLYIEIHELADYNRDMILYVDETENEEYFIVAGLMVESQADVEAAYKRFKKSIKGFNIKDRYKSVVYTEFKSTLLDNTYTRIKNRMVCEIAKLNGSIIYSCYIKKNNQFSQVLKESVYITLLSKIISEIEDEIDVAFDSFGKTDFEANIVAAFIHNTKVTSIQPKKSETEPGLQFIDNICSVIRLHKSGDEKDRYFDLIEGMIKEV